ncbi:MAG: DNA recombination protein RmuC [Candidatus Firestonebacteria bacterium]
MTPIITFIIGFALGILACYSINLLRKKEEGQRMKDSFKAMSLDAWKEMIPFVNEALSKQLASGEKDLENKKQLIDQTLSNMKTDLLKVENIMNTLEKDRENKFGELTTQIKQTAEQTGKLRETTDKLNIALSSSQARGKWGERMAEDVLRLAGFTEGMNYIKQQKNEAGNKPDFTFTLPKNLKVNMDVKFPLDNYRAYLNAGSQAERDNFEKRFLSDVKGRIKEVTTRDYINAEENTLDYVIVFIPNEQVFAFVNQKDPEIMDEALAKKVVLCSPLTLYALLVIMRQAIDNFKMEATAAEILKLLAAFGKQWEEYTGCYEKLGEKIQSAQEEFTRLVTTRKNKLDSVVNKIENLREENRLNLPEGKE